VAKTKSAKTYVLGIDPGISGAFVLFDGREFASFAMPIQSDGKNKTIHFDGVHELLDAIHTKYGQPHVYLERAVPMAMGAKSAFNYGRGFEAITIAIQLIGFPFTLIEPQKWAKEMHEGISTDLRAKAKSLIACQRLYPKLYASLPKNTKGKTLDGPIDALLIAAYGLRKLGLSSNKRVVSQDVGDFF
jgi:hypothetical protein